MASKHVSRMQREVEEIRLIGNHGFRHAVVDFSGRREHAQLYALWPMYGKKRKAG
jgi:hypothetical protein